MANKLTKKICLALFYLCCCADYLIAVPIDNDVEGVPEVACLAESAKIAVQTAKPFLGHIYVKGQFRVPGCHLDLTSSDSRQPNLQASRPTVIYEISYRGCVVKRERTINPPGLSFTMSVVVQFHHQFLTKVDRAYTITCFYVESTKTVTYGLDVSMLETTQLYQTRPMPVCSYDVLRGGLNGPVVRFAQVGEMAFHKWSCQGAAGVYGILVHSCSAADGTGDEYKLIDNKGCAIDPVIVNDITYTPDLTMAYVEVHVFKFADKMLLSIQCQVSLCLLNDNACNGITPPNCGRQGHPHAPQPLEPSQQPQQPLQPLQPQPPPPQQQQQTPRPPNPRPPASQPGAPPGNAPFQAYAVEATKSVAANYPIGASILPSYIIFPTPPPTGQYLNGLRQRQRRRTSAEQSSKIKNSNADGELSDRSYRLERTIDLTSEDIFIFNMDDQLPLEAVANGGKRRRLNFTTSPLVLNADESSEIDSPLPPSSSCTSTTSFTLSLMAVALFFMIISAGFAFYQRRYYINKLGSTTCDLRTSGFLT